MRNSGIWTGTGQRRAHTAMNGVSGRQSSCGAWNITGQKRQEWGVFMVIMNKRGNSCPKCLPWVGKVLIDDVWSGGSRKDGPYPLMSTAIAAGLYHPRCKDGHTTYFEGISTPPDSRFTRKELKQIEKDNRKEAQKQYAERQRGRFGRLADYSLNPENKRR